MTDTMASVTKSLRGVLRPSVMISVAAVLAAALLGVALIFAMGVSVLDAVAAFVDGTIGTPYAIAASINRSIAFALVGIGFVIANRANLVNVGGEGQIAMGGIAATAVALYGHVAGLPAGLPFLIPLLSGGDRRFALGIDCRRAQDQGRHQRSHQHAAVVVHRCLVSVLVRAVARAIAKANDQLGDTTGIA